MFALLALVWISLPNSASTPLREPQMAAVGSTVAMTFGAGNAVYFSRSQNAGQSFSPPVKVAETAILPLNRHRGPRIALSGSTIVISAVAGTVAAQGAHAHGLPSDGDLWVWRSTDGGLNWSKGIRVNDAPGAPTEGLHSLASGTDGTLFAAWLDKRSASGTTLYGAKSRDGGKSWSKNVAIYSSPEGSICECCHPSVLIESGGVLVMWRNWLAGARDMYLARSTDGSTFATAEKLGKGNWKLNACPMDGGGLVKAGNRVVSAWRREGEIFLASPGEKEVSLARGNDVSIAGASTGVYAVWTAPEGIMAVVPGGKAPLQLATDGAFPNIVSLGATGALAAWEQGGKIAVRVVR